MESIGIVCSIVLLIDIVDEFPLRALSDMRKTDQSILRCFGLIELRFHTIFEPHTHFRFWHSL